MNKTLQEAIDEWISYGEGNRHNKLMTLAWACYNNGYGDYEGLRDKLTEIWNANYADGNDTIVVRDCENTAKRVIEQADVGADAEISVLPKRTESQIKATRTAHDPYRKKWIEELMMAHSSEITAPFIKDEIAVYDKNTIDKDEAERHANESLEIIRKLAPLDDGEYIFYGTAGMQKSEIAYLDNTYTPNDALGMDDLWHPNPLKERHCVKSNLKTIRYICAEIDECLYDKLITEKVGSVERMAQMRREQLVFWNEVKDRLPIACMTSSGKKSIHVLMRVDTTTDEIDKMRGRLAQIYESLHLDRAGCTASQLTRTPWGVRVFMLSKNGALIEHREVMGWLKDSKNPNWDIQDEAKRKLSANGFDGMDDKGIEEKMRFIYQKCLYLNENVKPMTLPEFISALESIEAIYVPQVDNMAVKIKQDGIQKPYLSVELFQDFLKLSADGKKPMAIWFDEIKRKVRCEGFRTDDANHIVNAFQDAWQAYYGGAWVPPMEKVRSNVRETAAMNKVNPVTDWLETLVWKGKDMLAEAYELLGIEHDSFAQTLFHKWMLQCVAMAYNDGVKPIGADGVLTLCGKQGLGKTSFFRHLIPKEHQDDWWLEGRNIDVTNKDDIIIATSCWIGELGEVDDTLKREQASLKALVTRGTDTVRVPYAEHPEDFRRHCSWCATVNKFEFLKDSTGNRRWWTININKRMDFKKLCEFDSSQLWAQIKREYDTSDDKDGCFRLTADEQAILCQGNEQFTQEDETVDLIRDKYDFEHSPIVDGKAVGGKWTLLKEITRIVLEIDPKLNKIQRGDLLKVRQGLMGMGLKPSKRGAGSGYFMPNIWNEADKKLAISSDYSDDDDPLMGVFPKNDKDEEIHAIVEKVQSKKPEKSEFDVWAEGYASQYEHFEKECPYVAYVRDGEWHWREFGVDVEHVGTINDAKGCPF